MLVPLNLQLLSWEKLLHDRQLHCRWYFVRYDQESHGQACKRNKHALEKTKALSLDAPRCGKGVMDAARRIVDLGHCALLPKKLVDEEDNPAEVEPNVT